MGDQRSQRLLLQRPEAAIELIAARLVRSARPGIARRRVRSASTFFTLGHRAPDVDRRLVDGAFVAGSISRMFGGQRETYADQAVLSQVAVIARLLAVDAEVVGVDRTEQRVVRVGVALAPLQQVLIAAFRRRRRQPELLRRPCGSRRTSGRCRRVPASRSKKANSPRITAAQDSPPQRWSPSALARRGPPRQGACQRHINEEYTDERRRRRACLRNESIDALQLGRTFGPDCGGRSVQESLAGR